jgi:hypothetical protein
MLKRIATCLAATALTLTSLITVAAPGQASPAPASGGAACGNIVCDIHAEHPDSAPVVEHATAAKTGANNAGKGAVKAAKGASTSPFTCQDSDSKKKCKERKTMAATYDLVAGCSWRLQSPQDAPPAGKSATDGAWYECWPPIDNPLVHAGVTSNIRTEWRATPPKGVTKISPGQAAKRVVQSMKFVPVDIGVSPEVLGAEKWYVGMPMWLWAKNKGQANVTGPYTKSASEGGVSVKATARLASITYTMGDGGKVICTSGGTPYTKPMGKRPSPTCDYRYSKMSPNQGKGSYKITATSKWNVSWTADDQSGEMPMQVSSSRAVRVGEIQTLNVPTH